MKTDLSLELGEEEAGAICDCCGRRSRTVHGFVYRNGDAFAVYYAGWSPEHLDRGVTLAIATGEWAEGSGPADRVSIGLATYSKPAEIQCTVLDPEQSPWGETPLFGKMLPRVTALRSRSLKSTLEVAEVVTREDPRVRSVLSKVQQEWA